ncbi:hypothetical protein L2E82_06789 [Cichorium intybus]|uniref:Uncharacterized protein n=1 Tax=Cichorium intybus TaxID=13427 RepID=A0ACB9HD87_CICIN|nr:hypothetical protein L2E82_06789 [Cichorium intybus]
MKKRTRVISALMHIEHPVKHEEATTPPFFLPPAKSVPLEAAAEKEGYLEILDWKSIRRRCSLIGEAVGVGVRETVAGIQRRDATGEGVGDGVGEAVVVVVGDVYPMEEMPNSPCLMEELQRSVRRDMWMMETRNRVT